MKRFLVFLVVVAAGIVAAAFAVPSNAATVDGTTVSQNQLSSQLSAINSSKPFQCLLAADEAVRSQGRQQLPSVAGVSSGTYNTAFVRYWLSQMISATVVHQLAAERGITPTASEAAAARNDLLQSYESALTAVEGSAYQCTTNPQAFVAALPSSLVDSQAQLQASTEALLADSANGVSQRAIAQYFYAHRDKFQTLCVSGILVADLQTAEKVRNEIVAGTPFAQAAKDNSLDSTSAANGGSLGCFSPSSSNYAAVSSTVGSLATGTPSQPQQSSSGGYVLYEVTRRVPAPLSAVHALARLAVLQASERRVNTVLQRATKQAEVAVDPRYGRWTKVSATTGVLPPLRPPSTELLNPTANVPSPSTLSASLSATSASATGG